VLYELSGALKACQTWSESASVLHFNIKPTSVFLDLSGSIKLGNVGLMKPVDSNQNEVLDSSETLYMSPVSFLHNELNLQTANKGFWINLVLLHFL